MLAYLLGVQKKRGRSALAKRTTNEKAKVRFNTNDMLMPHARESRKNADEDSQAPGR